MHQFINLLIESGKSGVNLGLHILLPVMVIMMAFMRVIEKKGLLAKIAWLLSPAFVLFGLPGIGVFAMLQISAVSFAAPMATLQIMESDKHMNRRRIAATLAMCYTMSQANAAFPLAVKGLNIPILYLSSILGGLVASALAFYVFTRKAEFHQKSDEEDGDLSNIEVKTEKQSILKILMQGGEEGLQIVLKSIPLLILAIFVVNIFKATGLITLLSDALTPVLSKVGLSGQVVLPIATKFLAGGTAMMGVAMDMIDKGAMTALELNKIAGFIINPFDIVGITVLASVGSRTGSVVKPAIKASLIGIAFRGILHLIIF